MGKDADEKRDKRLRAALLGVFDAARISPSGGLLARRAIELAEEALGTTTFESDDHALGMMRDMKLAGLLTERPRGKRRDGQGMTPDLCEFAITEQGRLLRLQEVEKHKMVHDDRADPDE